jgi:prepilin-type N-terminal cleavage/methylation domain-containing protein
MSLARTRRRAFTLAELLVGIALFGVVGAITAIAVVRNNRSATTAVELAELRDHLHDAVSVLAADLRAVSSAGGDIYGSGTGKNSIEFRSGFGASLICAKAAQDVIAIPPNAVLSDGRRFTSIRKRVDPGHGVLVFDAGLLQLPDDDQWIARTITSVASVVSPCGTAPFVSPGDAAARGLHVTLDSPLPATVAVGNPVRFVERVRYALYLSGDGRWHLGYCASNNMSSSCGVLQPLSGPYLAPHPDQMSGLSGLDFYYYDVAGAPVVSLLDAARIDVAVRGAVLSNTPGAGQTGPVRDSVRVSINLRNR